MNLNGKHILIENALGMGDLIMLTPTLRKIKELYPECVLSVVSYPGNLRMIDRLSYVDNVYAIDKKKFMGRFLPGFHFTGQDYVVFTTWQSQLTWMAWIARVPHRAGVCKENHYGQKLVHTRISNDEEFSDEYKAKALARQVGEGLGIDIEIDDATEVSAPSDEEIEECRRIMSRNGKRSSRPYAVIAPFGDTARDISAEVINDIVKYLDEKYGMDSVIVHNKRMEALNPLENVPHVVDLCGKTNIRQMAAVIQNAALAVVTDSGPMHVACSLGVETAAVFSSGNFSRWHPRRHGHFVKIDCPCSPCDGGMSRSCTNPKCMDGITSEMVYEKIDEAIDAVRKDSKANEKWR